MIIRHKNKDEKRLRIEKNSRVGAYKLGCLNA